MSPTSREYNFGVEIESVVKPYGGLKSYKQVDWYRQLAEKLRNRDIPAIHDDDSRYSKHPEYYNQKWFVTRDGSIRRESPMVCMEVVSPKLTTQMALTETISDFWEAMSVHFDVQKDDSCGGHVHVTPLRSSSKFTLPELKQVAFAVAFYEDYLMEMLPLGRRANAYCVRNSHSTGRTMSTATEGCRLRHLLAGGADTRSLQMVASEIRNLSSEKELAAFMQKTRYVLWNFNNIHPNARGNCTGTVEFRGGSQFLSTSGTLCWVAFVLGFITLALDEDLLHTFSSYSTPTSPNMDAWWRRIKTSARKSKLSRHLPDDYRLMQKK